MIRTHRYRYHIYTYRDADRSLHVSHVRAALETAADDDGVTSVLLETYTHASKEISNQKKPFSSTKTKAQSTRVHVFRSRRFMYLP